MAKKSDGTWKTVNGAHVLVSNGKSGSSSQKKVSKLDNLNVNKSKKGK